MIFLRIVVGDWYKFLIFLALRHHKWRGSHSSLSIQTSFRQLKMWIGSVSSKVDWESVTATRIQENNARKRNVYNNGAEVSPEQLNYWIIKLEKKKQIVVLYCSRKHNMPYLWLLPIQLANYYSPLHAIDTFYTCNKILWWQQLMRHFFRTKRIKTVIQGLKNGGKRREKQPQLKKKNS